MGQKLSISKLSNIKTGNTARVLPKVEEPAVIKEHLPSQKTDPKCSMTSAWLPQSLSQGQEIHHNDNSSQLETGQSDFNE